jgi:hypothetical protein
MRTLDVEELAPNMGPAGGLLDAAGVVEVMEACVAIGLQSPAEVGQMAARMLAHAIRSVSEPDTWRGRAFRRAVVADIGPKTAGFDLAPGIHTSGFLDRCPQKVVFLNSPNGLKL